MSRGAASTLYIARAAALLYAAAIALFLAGQKQDPRARLAWTLGCALLWVHVALAFQFFHHWSHHQAIRYTAEQTARLTGVRTGIGIYLNYLFLLVWTVDCVFWWSAGLSAYRGRRRMVTLAVQAFLLFIAFNATVVFGRGSTRYVSLLIAVCLGLPWIARALQPGKARSVTE